MFILKDKKRILKFINKKIKTKIPADIDFNKIKGLSNEIKDILNKIKPSTISQASTLPGFTPTATLLLLRHLKREKRIKVVNE